MAENDKIPSDDYERELATDLDDDTPDKPKGMPLHTKILLGLLVGVVGRLTVNWTLGGSDPNVVWFVSNITQPVGTLFLSMLLMIVVPLVFSSLVVGVSGIDARLEDLDLLAGDLGTADAADELLALAAEHAAGDDLDPPGLAAEMSVHANAIRRVTGTRRSRC